MADTNNIPEEAFDAEIVTLTDEEGNESDFELIGEITRDGVRYLALTPVDEGTDEYVILREVEGEDGEAMLETIDDDDLFDHIADEFDDLFADM